MLPREEISAYLPPDLAREAVDEEQDQVCFH